MLPHTLQKAPSSPCLFINTLSKCVQWDTFRHLTHFNRDMPCLRLACSLRIKFLAHFSFWHFPHNWAIAYLFPIERQKREKKVKWEEVVNGPAQYWTHNKYSINGSKYLSPYHHHFSLYVLQTDNWTQLLFAFLIRSSEPPQKKPHLTSFHGWEIAGYKV